MRTTTLITRTEQDVTIEFVHSKPPKGKHKTHAIWLDRVLENATPIILSPSAYDELLGAYAWTTGTNPLRERRSDHALVLVIGSIVFMRRSPVSSHVDTKKGPGD